MATTRRRVKEFRQSLRIRTRSWVRAEYYNRIRPIRDLSTGGAFVRIERPPRPETEVEIILYSVRLPEPVRLKGIVRWIEPGTGMGVEFTSFEGEGKVNLADLLSNLVAPRIMLASHEENLRRDITSLFNKEGFLLILAPDGKEALRLAEQAQLDLILLDMDMPNTNGVEVLEGLRGEKNLENVPIVAMSASDDASVLGTAQKMGVLGSIPKPINHQRMMSFIRMMLER